MDCILKRKDNKCQSGGAERKQTRDADTDIEPVTQSYVSAVPNPNSSNAFTHSFRYSEAIFNHHTQ
jgi:hypothetical protein